MNIELAMVGVNRASISRTAKEYHKQKLDFIFKKKTSILRRSRNPCYPKCCEIV